MKQPLSKLVISALLLTLSACGDSKGQSNEYIDLVKYTVNKHTNLDTVEQVLDKWTVCTGGYWTSEEQSHNEDILLVSYHCDFDAKTLKDKAIEYYDNTMKSQGIKHALDVTSFTHKISFIVTKSNKRIEPNSIESRVSWEDGKEHKNWDNNPRNVMSMPLNKTPNFLDEKTSKAHVKKWVGKLAYYHEKSKPSAKP